MSNQNELWSPKISPITATWRPSIGFKLRVSSEDKRSWARYMKFRNHREKLGRPIGIQSSPVLNMELALLRNRIRELESNPLAGLETAMNPLSAFAGVVRDEISDIFKLVKELIAHEA